LGSERSKCPTPLVDRPAGNIAVEEVHMPLVNVKLIEGVFSPEQKQQIVRGLTEAMVAIEGENMRQVTWVVVEEVHSGDWGIAGQPLTTADVKALAAGTAVG
jgi:4-oxalocrotonate tautomerase